MKNKPKEKIWGCKISIALSICIMVVLLVLVVPLFNGYITHYTQKNPEERIEQAVYNNEKDIVDVYSDERIEKNDIYTLFDGVSFYNNIKNDDYTVEASINGYYKYYKIADGKIIEKSKLSVIWPYSWWGLCLTILTVLGIYGYFICVLIKSVIELKMAKLQEETESKEQDEVSV